MRITASALRPKALVNPGRGGTAAAFPAIFLAFVLFLIPCLPTALRAQGAPAGWPPIVPEELALKDNPASHGAHAMILFHENIVDDPHSVETEYFRVKIFDQEGKKYADIEIPYFEKETQIEEIRGRTVHPDGSTVEFQGVVYDRVVAKLKKFKYHAKVLALSDVQAGSIIEYSYRVHSHGGVPGWVKDPVGYMGSDTVRTASWEVQHELFTRRAHFVFHPYPNARLKWDPVGLSGKDVPRENPDKTIELEVENIPALEEEDLMPPESFFRSRVEFYYSFGYFGTAEQFWREIGRQRSEQLEEFLSKHKRVDRVAAETVAANDAPEVKLRKLYARAQQVRNLSYEHSRTEKERKEEHLSENHNVDDIVEHGYADGNQINFLFAALARAAGFDAQVLLLTSRARNLFRSELPDTGQLDAIVVVVRFGSTVMYLDPATHLCPYPLLPWEESGTGGVQLGKFGGTLATAPNPVSADAVIERKATLHVDKDGIVQGLLRVSFLGQEALTRRREMNDEDTVGRRKELEDEAKAWLPAGATVELTSATGWEIADEPLRAEYHVSLPNLVVTTPRRIMLPLAVSVGGFRSRLQNSRRTLPVYFRYPSQETDEVTLEVPSGYQVEALPGSHTREGLGTRYEISSQQQGKSIVLKRRLVIDGFYYKPEYYSQLRTFFDEVGSSDAERAVLKLAEAAAVH